MRHEIELKITGYIDGERLKTIRNDEEIIDTHDLQYTITINKFYTKVFKRTDFGSLEEFETAISYWVEEQVQEDEKVEAG
jgi:hypothetical protein